MLNHARSIQTFQKPSKKKVYRNLRRFYNNTKPLLDAGLQSVRTKTDQITLRTGRELASFDAWVERGIESLIGRLDGTLQVSICPS